MRLVNILRKEDIIMNNERTFLQKVADFFDMTQRVCCFTALLALIGGIQIFILQWNGILGDIMGCCFLIGIFSAIIAAPIQLGKILVKATITAAKIGICIPIIPFNFILALFFGAITFGVCIPLLLVFSGVVTLHKYFTELRYL